MSFITQIDQVLHHATSASDDRQISTSTLFNISGDFSTSLFKQLLLNAQKNCSASPKGRRHNEIIKKFSLSLFLTIGPSAYELLHINMPEAIPSLSTVEREANRRYSPLGEGKFIFDKLLAHLEGYTVQLKGNLIHAGILHACLSLVARTRFCVCTHTRTPKYNCNR